MKMRKQQDLVTDLRKNEDVWASLYDQLNRALMQVGDLVHYAGYVEA
jgi:predicted methyltransferase